MSNTSHPDDAGVPEAVGAADHDATGRLRSVVVTYEGTPDRRTLYPPEATEIERLTRWLTADDAAFERVDGRR
jgi:hypothetical protein